MGSTGLTRTSTTLFIDTGGVARYLRGRTVLVTGAGGSIGSELCRQVAGFGPRRLILLGHGENSIFAIQGELKEKFPGLETVDCIADIRDGAKMRRVFGEWRPQIVFHAAAHKHVPLMEENPDEAVTNSIFGTLNVARAAAEVGAERFVLISTDKAVNPVNCMGASKRVAEMIIQAMSRGSLAVGRPVRTRFVAVRFGNVLGSRGSVIPIFKRQIAAGGPVTVTHPEMKRYFMTIPEAVQLVLQAGAMGEGGEIYVLRMGQPIRIVDLAREMIRLSGLEPDVDIKIEFTGIRPGERLFEELHTDVETVEPTPHKDIVKLRVRQGEGVDVAWLEHGLRLLAEAVASGEQGKVRALLLAMGREEPALDRVLSQAEAASADERV
ncbi:MAG: polysaccharide biosynthesis protein [Limnochordales bacterium]|nr:polysaccharide biosynthesis protein [Limnochordales bacterium]